MGTTVQLGNALFGATRRFVLSLLFNNSGERYYQRRIIQAAGLGSGTVQRELDRLTRAGIITRSVEGRQTYFQANANCPIFVDLKQLVRKTFGVTDVLKDALVGLSSHIQVAFLYGSVAAGTERASSDIDLMVIGQVSLLEVVSAVADAQRELGREVNPSVFGVEEFCRKLSEGRQFLGRVTAGSKIFVIGDEQRLKGLGQIRVAQGARDQPGGNRRPSRRRGS